ncbi:MAG: homoserine kinase [Rhodospirillaceae bacterium TMED8]|nr:homoserine kinase [Magnetovibrio sp.]OUT51182.1 MAG: homoserine kinase [Rhodospirillaceae bacterium TMED8]
MAVFTEVSDEALVAFIAQYDIGEILSAKGIAEGVENSNYLLRTKEDSFILTLYENRVDPTDLPFFLTLKEHLAAKGIGCPVPIRARDGEVLHELSNRPAAIFTFLPGMWPRRIQPYHCGELGQALARMHLAGNNFILRRANNLSVQSWRPLLNRSADRADEVQQGLAENLEMELAVLELNWPDTLPSGVIHADLFPDNVFFRGPELTGLIDFYFACNDMFAYDIAICMNAWCFERDGSFNVTKAKSLLIAYRMVRVLSDDELAALPVLARGAAVRFMLTRLYDWLYTPAGALVVKKDPLEFWAQLRFHQRVTGPKDYGLA